MAETKKAPAAKAAPKAAAAKAAPKAAAKPAAAKKPAAPKAAKTAPQALAAGQVRVTQLGSPIGRTKDQAGTLVGLGLGKRHRSRVLADTPEVQGMIRAVQHLVKVEKA